MLRKVIGTIPQKATIRFWQSPHFWIIVAIFLFDTFIYYVDQSPWATSPPFTNSFFSSVHDLHRTLFLVPLVYAAFVFRVWGSLIASFFFLCVVLPRALIFSPYPDPLLRALIFVVAAAFISLLVATQFDRVEREEKARNQLNTAYRQLKESQEQLIQAEKLNSLGQLAASIAHEVNNPLSGVLIYIQLLIKNITAGKLPKEKALNYLTTVELEITRCSQLISNLRDFSRQTQPAFEPVNLNEVIEQALNLVAHSALLKHVDVVKELSPTLPEVMADLNQLQQVFINLMLNAIQAIPQGGTMTLRTLSSGAGEVRIDIKDTGIGISRENIQKLFTPFFTTKKEVKGVGLGLAVSYGIIKQHKGRIEVDSEEGKGSTFTIYLNACNNEER
ncbi:MAG: hypothetical protein A2Y90_02070 [Chloroflexi bacterium RBG_13_52_12]|nr:MAG: hypothetical protein A2Y90_02070 [Chloroflexi bacterium RBG_13_52_12]